MPSDDTLATGGMESFDSCCARYIAYLADVRKLSPHTVRAYEQDLQSFRSWIERSGADPWALTPRTFRRYLLELSRARYAPRTINRHLSAIRGLYRFLVREGVTTSDAVAAVMSPKVPKALPKALTHADVEAMLATCDVSDTVGLRDRAFLELLYASGARVAEMSALDVGDLDFKAAQVRLFGKGSKERIVPLYPQALTWAQRYLDDARPLLAARLKRGEDPPGDALFLSIRGRRMSPDALRTCFERHVACAGIDGELATHAMRHAYATELLGGGADLRTVQELLGHASLSTTQIYTHLSVERLKDAARQAHPRGE